ncbi:MAG TPA: hypothetical protein VN369_04675 [Terriglobales bacterium]|nr:hypothetical protein [Terriglobales bacterium]
MNEWSVVIVIVTLAGLLALLAKPVASYSASAAKTAVLVDALYRRMECAEDCAREMDGRLDNHETRITVLEVKKG